MQSSVANSLGFQRDWSLRRGVDHGGGVGRQCLHQRPAS